jgi:A/G-specific adenine glycosylase
MLQQTRVETVLSYWPKFLARFPDLRSLARCEESEVLAAWSGLGYYRRARALREAARAIVERHGGEFPRERESVLALPGIGRYTAGAVLSIALGQREALVDGNVARVFSRWFALEDPVGSSASQRRLWELAEQLLPAHGGAGEWNQALMELGALLCTAKSPRCEICPVSRHCTARAQGRVAQLPRPKPRASVLDVFVEVLVVRRGDQVLLEQRADDAPRMAGLYELPTREVGTQTGLYRAHWEPRGALEPGRELGRARHTITRHRIEVCVREGRLESAAQLPSAWTFVDAASAPELGLTGMARKVLRGGKLLAPGPESRNEAGCARRG